MIRPVIFAAVSLSVFSLSPAAGEDKRVRPWRNRYRNQDRPNCAVQRADLVAERFRPSGSGLSQERSMRPAVSMAAK